MYMYRTKYFFFFQAEDGIRDLTVTGVQTCALPILACVSPVGRITPGCAGMYAEEHTAAWRRIVDFIHAKSNAKFCLQLGHSGRKGSTKIAWEGMDEPLDSGNWEVIGPSAIPFSAGMHLPRAMTRADLDKVKDDF